MKLHNLRPTAYFTFFKNSISQRAFWVEQALSAPEETLPLCSQLHSWSRTRAHKSMQFRTGWEWKTETSWLPHEGVFCGNPWSVWVGCRIQQTHLVLIWHLAHPSSFWWKDKQHNQVIKQMKADKIFYSNVLKNVLPIFVFIQVSEVCTYFHVSLHVLNNTNISATWL